VCLTSLTGVELFCGSRQVSPARIGLTGGAHRPDRCRSVRIEFCVPLRSRVCEVGSWFLGPVALQWLRGLGQLGSMSETCVGSRVHLVGPSISFEKNFYWTCHNGAVTSVKSAEMPAAISAPTFTTTAITAPTKQPQVATTTTTNKSSQASLQLTHELGGYIRRMRLRAPTENVKNITNTKNVRLSLRVTP
jgi:hypothetical protein